MHSVVGVRRRGWLTWELGIQKSLYHGRSQADLQKFRPEIAVVLQIPSWVRFEEGLLVSSC